MKIHCIGLIGVCLLPAFVFAQPSTQPVRPRDGMGGPAWAAGAGPRGRGGRGGRPTEEAITWTEVESFFKENSPQRYQVFEKLPEEQQAKLQQILIRRFQAMIFLARDSELFDLRKKQVMVEDDMFGIHQKVVQLPEGDPEKLTAALKEELLKKAKEWVDLRMQERQLHVDRLKKALDDEVENLAKDRGKEAEMAQKRFEEELESPGPAGGLLPGGPGQRRRGMDGGDGGGPDGPRPGGPRSDGPRP